MADVYNQGKFRIETFAMASEPLEAMLLNASYSYDPDDSVVTDIDTNEISGSGYSRQSLTSVTVTEDVSGNLCAIAAAEIDFGSIVAGETVSDLVVFITDGNQLLSRVSLTNQATNGQTFTVQFNGADPGTFIELVDATTVDVYNSGKFLIAELTTFGSNTFSAMLMNSSYSFNVDDREKSDIDANELSGSGYSAPGLATVSLFNNDGDDTADWRSDAVSFGSIVAGETATDCVIFRTAGDQNLICRVPITPTATNGQAFGIDFENDATAGDFMRLHETDPG